MVMYLQQFYDVDPRLLVSRGIVLVLNTKAGIFYL